MLTALGLVERCVPLRGMLIVFPPAAIGLDIGVGAILEGHRLRGLKPFLRPRGLSIVDRVNAVQHLEAKVSGALARVGKANSVKGAEFHFPSSAVDHVAEDPRLRVEGAHLKVKAVAIAVETRLARGSDGRGGQFVALPFHLDIELDVVRFYAQL